MESDYALDRRLTKNSMAIKVTFIYMIIGGVWLFFANKVINGPIHNTASENVFFFIQESKDFVFIGVTSVILYTLIQKFEAKRHKHNLELKKSEDTQRLYAKVFEYASEGIMITDNIGRILSVNPAFTSTTGYTQNDIIGKNPRVLQSDLQDDQFYMKMWEAIHTINGWQGEIWNRRKDGMIYPQWLSIDVVRDENSKVSHYVGVFYDITERKKSEERLHHLAHYDMLTGLPNRFLFHDRLNQAVLSASQENNYVGVLFLDLDRFKFINDTLGHAIGDQLLQGIAEQLKSSGGSDVTVSRFGGDEFTILLPHIGNVGEPIALARRIIEAFEQPFVVGSHELIMTTSIGISIFPMDGTDIDTLVKNADSAMYRAKESRNTYHLYSIEMNEILTRRMMLEQGIRKALEQDQFLVYYQPQIEIRTGLLIGMEALLRWNHPVMGMIPPSEFIPIAEENNMIIGIGKWILRKVCIQIKSWQLAGYSPVKIAVNISAKQFIEKNLVDAVKSILNETGVEACYLGIEITESKSIQCIDSIIDILREFYELGVEVSIDDFGTGHSNLSYLKNYPIHLLKIDKSFIDEIYFDSGNAAIVKAIVEMAHGLNIRAIAEGVETREQLDVLKDIGCDSIQGYLISRPLPVDQVVSFFNRGAILHNLNMVSSQKTHTFLS